MGCTCTKIAHFFENRCIVSRISSNPIDWTSTRYVVIHTIKCHSKYASSYDQPLHICQRAWLVLDERAVRRLANDFRTSTYARASKRANHRKCTNDISSNIHYMHVKNHVLSFIQIQSRKIFFYQTIRYRLTRQNLSTVAHSLRT